VTEVPDLKNGATEKTEESEKKKLVHLHRHQIMLIGLISDTHGQMRDSALRALQGVELILHAGDVGRRGVLDALRAVAPVHAVYGNVDARDGMLVDRFSTELAGQRIHMSHGHELGSPTPETLIARYDADVVIYGHTHRPLVQEVGPTLVINPGAAGPARFNLKPSVALLTLPERLVRLVWLAA
jgi:putative phosphoesterase